MGFRFRKSFKIAPCVRLNVGKKGISSVSVGGRGARITVSGKKTTTTLGIPNSGLSYSTSTPHRTNRQRGVQNLTSITTQNNFDNNLITQPPTRHISALLLIGIALMPYIFVWFTLRKGYSNLTRLLCFGWLIGFFVLLKALE